MVCILLHRGYIVPIELRLIVTYTYIHTTKFIECQNREERIGGAESELTNSAVTCNRGGSEDKVRIQ